MNRNNRTAIYLVIVMIVSAVIGLIDIYDRLKTPEGTWTLYAEPTTSDTEKPKSETRSTAQIYVDIQRDIAETTGEDKARKSLAFTTCKQNNNNSLADINACYYKRLSEKAQ